MIDIKFDVCNPWDTEFKSLYEACGDFPIKNKHWEIQLMRDNILLGLNFSFTTRYDHAGLNFRIGLFGLVGCFNLYDSRHWDDERNCWEEYDE